MTELRFMRVTDSLEGLFPGLNPKCDVYAQTYGKIDGYGAFLEFIITNAAITVLVDHGKNMREEDNREYEFSRDVHSVEQGKQIVQSIDWSDINSEQLSNGYMFDFHQYGTFSSTRPSAPPEAKCEVIWLDIEELQPGAINIVDIGETIAIAVEKLGPGHYWYDALYDDRGSYRKALVYCNTYGLNDDQIRILIRRWIRAGGVI